MAPFVHRNAVDLPALTADLGHVLTEAPSDDRSPVRLDEREVAGRLALAHVAHPSIGPSVNPTTQPFSSDTMCVFHSLRGSYT